MKLTCVRIRSSIHQEHRGLLFLCGLGPTGLLACPAVDRSLGLLLSARPRYYSCCRISGKRGGNECAQSQEVVSLSVPEVQTELGRRAFMYSATSARKPELNECGVKAHSVLSRDSGLTVGRGL